MIIFLRRFYRVLWYIKVQLIIFSDDVKTVVFLWSHIVHAIFQIRCCAFDKSRIDDLGLLMERKWDLRQSWILLDQNPSMNSNQPMWYCSILADCRYSLEGWNWHCLLFLQLWRFEIMNVVISGWKSCEFIHVCRFWSSASHMEVASASRHNWTWLVS